MNTSNLAEVLDRGPMTPTQAIVAVLCGMVALMDGFDTQSIGYVAPSLIQSWHIPRAALGPVFSAGLIGSLLGAILLAPLADRFGRKPVLIGCTLVFGLGALASSLATSVLPLSALRMATGLGMGGAMPVAISLTSEYMPMRLRSSLVTVIYCGFSVGAALGGVAANRFIDRFGWQSVFIIGGLAPVVLVACMAFWLPESIGFLMRGNWNDKKISALLRKLGIAAVKPGNALRSSTPPHSRDGLRQLFSDSHGRLTPFIWLIVFLNLLELYFFSNWLPTLLNGAGITLGHASLISALFQVGGTAGALVIATLIDRFSKFRVMAVVYFSASVLVGSVGYLLSRSGTPTGIVVLLVAITLSGACVVGGQIGIITVTAAIYPVAIRSSGVGWALGVGRIGSVAGPVLGSALIAAHVPDTQLFLIGALPVLVAAVVSQSLDIFYSPAREPSTPQA
jgi:MFS transporter, AAHS family, 4-hydroxybenzoate transporter